MAVAARSWDRSIFLVLFLAMEEKEYFEPGLHRRQETERCRCVR
jgi:hypothetical protein